MEEKYNYNGINDYNLPKIKMNTYRKNYNLRNGLFNKNNNEESKNKQIINENNHQPNTFRNKVKHNKNCNSISGKERFNQKYKIVGRGNFNIQLDENL